MENGDRMTTTKAATLEALRSSTAAAITRTEAAAVLGVDPRTISAAINQGTVPAIRLGAKVLIPRERFLALFDLEETE